MSLSSFDPGLWVPVADVVVKVSLLLGVAAALSFALRGASASVRHVLWTVALLASLALPVFSLVLPRWQMPLVRLAAPVADQSTASGATMPEAPTLHRQSRPAAVQSPHEPAVPVVQTTVGGVQPATFLRGVSWPAVAIGIWAMGCLAILARLVIGVLAVQWMSRRTERVVDAPWLPLARELADEVGVSPRLSFQRSARATMPMAWGIVSPSVLMPADADDWPADRLRIVLLHELAHVKRRDCLTHMLAQLACALYWFNPLAWMAARRARTERERACDDLVLAAGTEGPDYAQELLEIARVMRAGRFPVVLAGATLAMAHRTQLEGRVIAILDPKVPRSAMTRLRTAAATALAACALVPLAAVQPWAYSEPSTPTAQQPAQPAAVSQPSQPPQHAMAHEQAPQSAPSRPGQPIESAPGQAAADREAVAQSQGLVQGIAQGMAQSVTQSVTQGVTQSVTQGVTQGVVQGAVQGAAGAALGDMKHFKVDVDPDMEMKGQHASADPRTIAALTAALKDTDREVRETAMHALVQLRDPAIYDPLVQALHDQSADVREQAAFGLGQLRDRRAVDPLTAALKDQNPSVREQAAFALGQLHDPKAVDALILALKDENPSVREQSAFALSQIKDARSVDALAAALKDSNPSVREQVAFALGQLHDRRAVPGLIAALTDSSEDVREKAVFALGQLRDPSAIDGLIIAMRDSKPDVREQAVFALGQIRDRKALEPLISALKDAAPDVRQQAAFALGQIRDRGAVEALVIALKDSDADVREQAAFALGQIRDPRAIDGLTAALKDSSAGVRQQAAFALGQLAR